ncbi:uncharacterized protein F5891DRAFT_977616 [Suillus fuscotomentosus]|uniref:Uncharacterized protein n=1 Tax=Suillus fuscotomentosus TaxID=1912939 RepID=A0AAD4HNU6_9AGAM|nr:uncharacterized protein F5891DRAFT_977616 [Suillus fuscotomentosus]KAG1903493.1 hypothetical protein F5891DRAFT_977616 [Suillus fuscotomentosus]
MTILMTMVISALASWMDPSQLISVMLAREMMGDFWNVTHQKHLKVLLGTTPGLQDKSIELLVAKASFHTALLLPVKEPYQISMLERLQSRSWTCSAYVKMMCNLQGVQFYLYLSQQFSIALDVYLQILTNVDTLLHKAIGRQDPNWCLKHCCPACIYTLQDEDSLKFKILFTMDGNDSLKRVLKRLSHDSDLDNLDGMESRVMQRSSDLPTMQCVHGDRYLSREFVESFRSNDLSMDMLGGNDEDNPCIGQWKNMRDDKTKRMWGVFNESGIFLAVCRHGFSLLIVDMIWSGEQVKYPLAILSKLLDVFGRDLGSGYDIGCRFKTTLHHSILGQCLRLEDLEGCERTFSKSNALASSVQYASAFHCCQTITHYFQHNDKFEIYANLTTFLYNNYKQALGILHDGQQTLPKLMHELGVMDESVFDVWLDEERNYLLSLSHEPKHETLQMEYGRSWMELNAASAAWIETARQHAIENYKKDLKMVQELEGKLDISRRWVPEDQEWRDTGCLVANHKFQHALDHLEGLVVAQIFELSKMNRAGTAAIHTALDHYNAATRSLSPPCPSLTWEEVVEYAFLSDFDLLRDARQDVSQHPWATPTGCLTMDTYFKMCCFMGSIIPGMSIEQGPGASASIPTVCIPSKLIHDGLSMPQEGEDDLMEDLEEEEDTEVDGLPQIHNTVGEIDELAVVHSEHKGTTAEAGTDIAETPIHTYTT